jgi:hypothetical protein
MTTLVLSPRYTPDSIQLRRAALEAGWAVERLQSYRVAENLRGIDIALYGEALFTTIIAEELGYILLEAPADWLGKLPIDYVKRQIQFTTLGAVRKHFNNPVFIKPAEGKSFAAHIYNTVDELPSSESQPDDMPVYVVEPVQWSIEFRCYVMERKLITLSIYSRNGAIAEIDGEWLASDSEIAEASAFCETLLQDNTIAMPPAFVLDIGQIVGRGWAVIETNPVWASGIYGCNAARILPILQRACIRADTISDEDRRWQINRFAEGEA